MLCNSKNGGVVLEQSAAAESFQSSTHNADGFNNVDGLNGFCHNACHNDCHDICNNVYHNVCKSASHDVYFLINADNLNSADETILSTEPHCSKQSNKQQRTMLSIERNSSGHLNDSESLNTADSQHELSLYTAQHKDSMDAVVASLLWKIDRCPDSHILNSVVYPSNDVEQDCSASQSSSTCQGSDTSVVNCVAALKQQGFSTQASALEKNSALDEDVGRRTLHIEDLGLDGNVSLKTDCVQQDTLNSSVAFQPAVIAKAVSPRSASIESLATSELKVEVDNLASLTVDNKALVDNAASLVMADNKSAVNDVEMANDQELRKRVDSALEYVSSLVKFQLDKHQPLFKTLWSCKNLLRSLGIKVCKVAPKNLRYLNFAGSAQPSWAYALSSSNSHDLYWLCGMPNDYISHGTKSNDVDYAVAQCVALGYSVQGEAANPKPLGAYADTIFEGCLDSPAEHISSVGALGASADCISEALDSPYGGEASNNAKKFVMGWHSESVEFQENECGSQSEVAFDPNLHHHNIALVGESNNQNGASSILSQAALGMANLIGLPIYDAVGMETFVNRQCQESADHPKIERSQTDYAQSNRAQTDGSQSDRGQTDCFQLNPSQNSRAQNNCSQNEKKQMDVQQSTGLGQTHCIATSGEQQPFLQKEQCMAQHKDSIFNRSSDALLKLQSFNEFLAKKDNELKAKTLDQQNTDCDAEKLTHQSNSVRSDISAPHVVSTPQDLSAENTVLADKALNRSSEPTHNFTPAESNMQTSSKKSTDKKASYGQRKSLLAQDFGIAEDAQQRRNFAAAFQVGDLELVFQEIKERSVHQEWLESLGHAPIVTRLALHICCRWIQRRCNQVQMLAPHEIQDSETEIYFDTVSLLIQTMTFAMRVDENIDPQERQVLYDFCLNLFGSQITNIRGEVDRCLTMPLDVNTLVDKIHYPEESLDIFMLSAVILDGCGFISEGYLESLAACLKIDPSLQRYLHYRAQNLLSKGASGVDFKELDRLYVENLAGVSALESC